MAYTEHSIEKSEKIVESIVGLVEPELTVTKLINHQGFDAFKGAKGDTLTQRVPGRLPAREYAWRNDRTNGIVYDLYKEGKVDISLAGHLYSATQLTDEQYEFDLGSSWMKLADAQARGVAQGMNTRAAAVIENAPYEVTIGGVEPAIRSALVEARKVLNKLRTPNEQRILLVGSDFEAAILNDDGLTLTSNVAQARAESALADATIGRLQGFTVVSTLDIDPGSAYAFIPSAFVQLTAAPYVPDSVPFGASKSYGGFALRWMRDYDTEHFTDRSVVDAYVGQREVKDIIIPREVEAGDAPFDPNTLEEHFVRGIKLTLDGVSDYPDANSDLADSTGVSDANAWVAPSYS